MAPYVYMTRALLPKMLEREKRGAIIFTSSVGGLFPLPYLTTYAGTKAFNKHFAEGLAYENPEKIDVLAYTPWGVKTGMNPQE